MSVLSRTPAGAPAKYRLLRGNLEGTESASTPVLALKSKISMLHEPSAGRNPANSETSDRPVRGVVTASNLLLIGDQRIQLVRGSLRETCGDCRVLAVTCFSAADRAQPRFTVRAGADWQTGCGPVPMGAAQLEGQERSTRRDRV